MVNEFEYRADDRTIKDIDKSFLFAFVYTSLLIMHGYRRGGRKWK